MSESLQMELSVHRSSGRSLSIAMIDLDHFKEHNDRFGHAEGDELLRGFGELLRRRLRQRDLAMRIGGEEFLVVLPETDAAGGTRVIGELLRVGAGVDPDGRTVTLSVGLALWDGEESGEELIKRADAALYAAKQGGRNRLMLAVDGPRAPRAASGR